MAKRRVLRDEAHNGAVATCEVEYGERGTWRDYAILSKKAVKSLGLPGRLAVATVGGGFTELIFSDMVLRHVPDGSVMCLFRRGEDGTMQEKDTEAVGYGVVEGGWAKAGQAEAIESVSVQLLGEAYAMDVRLDG